MASTELARDRRNFAPDETRLLADDGRRVRPGAAEPAVAIQAAPVATEHRNRARHFVRHLIEMILAMLIGMAILGALWRAILAACSVNASDFRLRHAAVVALVMAFNMTVPMVWWMRHRGHEWARGAEMASAMFVPTLFLIALMQVDIVTGDSLIGLEHALMLPAMVGVMLWRIDEYTRQPRRRSRRRTS